MGLFLGDGVQHLGFGLVCLVLLKMIDLIPSGVATFKEVRYTTLDERRSQIKAEEPALIVPSWGTSLSCAICQENSKSTAWGRTARVRKPDGAHDSQPVGDACSKHYMFHSQTMSWMPWDKFAKSYHESEAFRESIDAGVFQFESKAKDREFATESVAEEDNFRYEIAMLGAYLLQAGHYASLFGVEPK